VPTDRYPQDERLERLEDYLLGLLPKAEAEQLDELSIADEEFAWQLRAAEDDLVDAYVRDGLPLTTRARFEEYYLASPRHRERVAFARSLAQTVDRAVDRPVRTISHNHPTPAPAHETVRPVVRSQTAWWLMAAAAVVVVAVGAMLMRTGLLRPSADTPTRTVASTAPGRESAASPVTAASPVSTPSISAAPAAVDRTRSKPAVTPDAITLAPDTRAARSIITVTVPAGAERIAFDLRLETNDFPRYQATLKDPGTDRAVWQSGWTTASVKRDSPVVPVAVPARTLKPQHYTFELTGRTDANRTDLVASYVFEVIPR
jgi:hypothetical protein